MASRVNIINRVYIVCASKYHITDTDFERMYCVLTSTVNGSTPHNIQLHFLGNGSASAKSVAASTKVKSWKIASTDFTPFQKLVHKSKYLVVFRKSFREPDKVIKKLLKANKKARILAI